LSGERALDAEQEARNIRGRDSSELCIPTAELDAQPAGHGSLILD